MPTAEFCSPARLGVQGAASLFVKSWRFTLPTISLFVLALHRLTSLIMRAWAAKRRGSPGIDIYVRSSSIRMWPPLPIRSTTAQCLCRIWMSSNSKPTSSDLRNPQPNSMANMA
jgi:hypothetical protein